MSQSKNSPDHPGIMMTVMGTQSPGSPANPSKMWASPQPQGNQPQTPATPTRMSPGHVFSSPAPVLSSPAPVFSSPAPVIRSPAPVIRSPAPCIISHGPNVVQVCETENDKYPTVVKIYLGQDTVKASVTFPK